jgi:integrase
MSFRAFSGPPIQDGQTTRMGIDYPRDHRHGTGRQADELCALMIGKDREDLVLTGTRGAVLRGGNYWNRYFSAAVAKCEKVDETFPDITPHALRRTAASLAVSRGSQRKAVQRMLVHEGVDDAGRLRRRV